MCFVLRNPTQRTSRATNTSMRGKKIHCQRLLDSNTYFQNQNTYALGSCLYQTLWMVTLPNVAGLSQLQACYLLINRMLLRFRSKTRPGVYSFQNFHITRKCASTGWGRIDLDLKWYGTFCFQENHGAWRRIKSRRKQLEVSRSIRREGVYLSILSQWQRSWSTDLEVPVVPNFRRFFKCVTNTSIFWHTNQTVTLAARTI